MGDLAAHREPIDASAGELRNSGRSGPWPEWALRLTDGHLFVAFALLLAFVSGHLVPGLRYRAATGFCITGLVAAGGVLVGAVTGAAARDARRVYWRFTAACFALLVAATWYASMHGPRAAWWIVERSDFGDDQFVYEQAVLPYVGLGRSLELDERVTNAPLFWLVNVWVQRVAVWLDGEPCIALSLALNVVAGAIAAALSVGAAFFFARDESRREAVRWARRLCLACPWLLASSVMFLRDVWLYAVVAAVLFVGARLHDASPWPRIATAAVATPPLAVGVHHLRREMVLPFVALLLLAVFARHLSRARAMIAAAAVVGLGVLGAGSAFVGVAEIATARATQYQEMYLASAASSGGRNQGTVSSLVGGSLVTRAVVQTAWLPVFPLPKVSAFRGSAYDAARQSMPLWVIACLASLWHVRRRLHAVAVPLLAWCAALAVAVGVTSGEARHFYAVVPAVVIAVALSLAGAGRVVAARGARRATRAAAWALVGSIAFTLLFFGPGVLLG
jgi:hypothetical protein